MLKTYTHKKITWIDVHKPTEEEIESLSEKYSIHSLVMEDLMSPSARSKVDIYKKHIYLILHFPVYNHEKGASDMYEIDFIVGKDYIITAHYQETPILEKFADYFENRIDKDDVDQIKHAGHILYFLLRFLYRALESHLEKISQELDIAEEEIFSGNPREMVEFLALLNHNVLDFKGSLKRHGPIISSLDRISPTFFDSEFTYYVHSINGEYTKVWNITEDNKELVKDLQETNDSLLNTRSNEIMKNLTIMAFITFPLTLIASIFGMNTSYMPIIGSVHDFWIVLGIMIVGMALMLAWFRHKKWL